MLSVNKTRQPLFYVDGVEHPWPCSSYSHSMQIDTMPSLVVYIPVGIDIKDPSNKYDPVTDILLRAQEAETKSQERLLGCRLDEEDKESGESTTVFIGYIVRTTLTVTSGGLNGSAKLSVRVDCAPPAVMLTRAPISSYLEMSVGALLNNLDLHSGVAADAAKKGISYNPDFQIGLLSELADKDTMSGLNVSIQQRLALAVSAARCAGAVDETKDVMNIQPDPYFNLAFGGVTTLKNFSGAQECSHKLSEFILKSIYQGMNGGSIWDAILRTLVSKDMLLHVIPMISCSAQSDCRFKIAPYMTDSGEGEITLNIDDILSLTANNNPAAALQFPEVVLALFGNPYDYDTSKGSAGAVGVAAIDEEMEKELQSRVRNSEYTPKLNESEYTSVRQISVPAWLKEFLPKMTTNVSNSANSGVANLKQPEVGSNINVNDTNRTPSLDDNAWDVANLFARASLLNDYRATSMLRLNINPALRTGFMDGDTKLYLEDNLGCLFGVVLNDDNASTLTRPKIAVRGVLTGVVYEYSSGYASSASYRLELQSIRVKGSKADISDRSPLYDVKDG